MAYLYEAELRNKRTVLVRGKKIICNDAMTDCKKVFEFSTKSRRICVYVCIRYEKNAYWYF